MTLEFGGAVLVEAPGSQHEKSAEQDEGEPDQPDEQREGEPEEEEVERHKRALPLPEGGEPDGAQDQNDATEELGVGGDGDGVLPILGDLVLGNEVEGNGDAGDGRQDQRAEGPFGFVLVQAGHGGLAFFLRQDLRAIILVPGAPRGRGSGEGAHDPSAPGSAGLVAAVLGGGRHGNLRVPVPRGTPNHPVAAGCRFSEATVVVRQIRQGA